MISYEYLWEDGSRYKRPTKLPAPDYVDALMNWAQALLDDEAVFPNRIGKYTKLSSPPLIVNLLNLPAPHPLPVTNIYAYAKVYLSRRTFVKPFGP